MMDERAQEALKRLVFHWHFSAAVSNTHEPIAKQPIPMLDGGITRDDYDTLVILGYATVETISVDRFLAEAKDDLDRKAREMIVLAQNTATDVRFYTPTEKALAQETTDDR